MKAAPIGTHRVFFSSSPLLLSSLELSDTTIHEPSIPCVCGRLRGAFCRGNQHTSQAGHALRSTCRRLESCTTARLSSPAHTSHTSAPNGGFNQHQTTVSIRFERRFLHQNQTANRRRCTEGQSSVPALISHNVFLKSFCKSQFPHKFVKLSFILVIVKDN